MSLVIPYIVPIAVMYIHCSQKQKNPKDRVTKRQRCQETMLCNQS